MSAPDGLGPYIRPCAAFPDGYFIPSELVPVLVNADLIVKDDWSDNHTDEDYQAVYSDEDMIEVADTIVALVRTNRVDSNVRGA